MDYISLFIAIIIIFIFSFFGLKILRKKEDYKRTLNLTFLQVTMPKKNSQLDEKEDTAKDFKEMVSIMEQLYSSLKSIYSRKIMKT